MSFQREESDNGEKESSLFHFFQRWRPGFLLLLGTQEIAVSIEVCFLLSLTLSLLHRHTDTFVEKNKVRAYFFLPQECSFTGGVPVV